MKESLRSETYPDVSVRCEASLVVLACGFFAELISDPEDGGDMFLRNVGLKLNGLHSVISQKMVFF
jgi:hypothetical protein